MREVKIFRLDDNVDPGELCHYSYNLPEEVFGDEIPRKEGKFFVAKRYRNIITDEESPNELHRMDKFGVIWKYRNRKIVSFRLKELHLNKKFELLFGEQGYVDKIEYRPDADCYHVDLISKEDKNIAVYVQLSYDQELGLFHLHVSMLFNDHTSIDKEKYFFNGISKLNYQNIPIIDNAIFEVVLGSRYYSEDEVNNDSLEEKKYFLPEVKVLKEKADFLRSLCKESKLRIEIPEHGYEFRYIDCVRDEPMLYRRDYINDLKKSLQEWEDCIFKSIAVEGKVNVLNKDFNMEEILSLSRFFSPSDPHTHWEFRSIAKDSKIEFRSNIKGLEDMSWPSSISGDDILKDLMDMLLHSKRFDLDEYEIKHKNIGDYLGPQGKIWVKEE